MVASKKHAIPVVRSKPPEEVRKNCATFIQKSLTSDQNKVSKDLGKRIEAAVLAHYEDPTSEDYKTRIRSLASNLKDNEKLRLRVVTGEVTPEALAGMTHYDLATPKLQEEIRHVHEESMRQATRTAAATSLADTSMYQCSTCLSKHCDYVDLDDIKDSTTGKSPGSPSGEPELTRLVTCLGCGKRWRTDNEPVEPPSTGAAVEDDRTPDRD